jgi:hypothetical protein
LSIIGPGFAGPVKTREPDGSSGSRDFWQHREGEKEGPVLLGDTLAGPGASVYGVAAGIREGPAAWSGGSRAA